MGRDHEGDADRRLAEESRVGIEVELADRPHRHPATEVDRGVVATDRDDLPPVGIGVAGAPCSQPVDDGRERVAWSARAAVDEDGPLARDRRSRHRGPELGEEPRLEHELALERDPHSVEVVAQERGVEHRDRLVGARVRRAGKQPLRGERVEPGLEVLDDVPEPPRCAAVGRALPAPDAGDQLGRGPVRGDEHVVATDSEPVERPCERDVLMSYLGWIGRRVRLPRSRGSTRRRRVRRGRPRRCGARPCPVRSPRRGRGRCGSRRRCPLPRPSARRG